jgi:glycine/D-amino acid oxidase-like deaminating enzyme
MATAFTGAALVVGAGIAGLATALRLSRSRWEVVLLDHGVPHEPVTVAFHDHDDEWFDIVVCAHPCCEAERLPGLCLENWSRDHVALLYRAVRDTGLPLSAAELLADAFDVHTDDRAALGRWETTLKPHTIRRAFTRVR